MFTTQEIETVLDELEGEAFELWPTLALAVIVRAAEHVPKGSAARVALAEASVPLRDHLYGDPLTTPR